MINREAIVPTNQAVYLTVNSIGNRRHFEQPWIRMTTTASHVLPLILCALISPLGGCLALKDKPFFPSTPSEPPPSLAPLSDDEAESQLTRLGKAIVSAVQLPNVDAGFAFSSCNDQGDPPHQGSLEIGFTIPSGQSPDGYLDQVAAHMKSLGWVDGPPPGKTYVGKVLSIGGIVAQLRPPTVNDPKAVIEIDGECRDMTDHKTDGKGNGHDVTAAVTNSP